MPMGYALLRPWRGFRGSEGPRKTHVLKGEALKLMRMPQTPPEGGAERPKAAPHLPQLQSTMLASKALSKTKISHNPKEKTMTQKLILDVDTGTDDAVALMLAALSPDLELVGATTVNGNTLVHNCTENSLRVFDYIGKPIPVFEGMALPLSRPDIQRGETSQAIHGDLLDLPAARSKKQSQHAVDWLVDTYMQSDGDIILVPVGPLTNIAAAIRKEPRILDKIPEIVIMGGAHEHGNITPMAEFNIWVDPEAARIVVNCGRPIRMIPLDATHRALVSHTDCNRLREIGTPAAIATAIVVEKRIAGYDATQPMNRHGAAPVHDALAVCAILDPSVVTTHFIHVDVETKGELTDGRTVCDFKKRGTGKPNVHYAIDADEPKFVRMLTEILGHAHTSMD